MDACIENGKTYLGIKGKSTADILRHGQCTQAEYEARRWQAFREYQRSKRRSLEEFKEYRASLLQDHKRNFRHQYYQRRRLDLELDITQQTQLDEWTEYALFEEREWLRLKDKHVRAPSDVEEEIKSTKRRRKKLEGLVNWVESQFPAIEAEMAMAAEQAKPSRRSRQSRFGLSSRSSARIASKTAASSDTGRSTPLKRARFASSCQSAPLHTSKISRISKRAINKKHPLHRQKAISYQRSSSWLSSLIEEREEEGPTQPNGGGRDRSGRVEASRRNTSCPKRSKSSGVTKRQNDASKLSRFAKGLPTSRAASPSNGTTALRRSQRIRARMELASYAYS